MRTPLQWSRGVILSEAQGEYVARCRDSDCWAGGPQFRQAVDWLVADPRFRSDNPHSNSWGIWGLSLGEWVADEGHANYFGAPVDGSAWRQQEGPPGAMRGGGVLHAPWQDQREALSCHVATRAGPGSDCELLTVRPISTIHKTKAPRMVPLHLPATSARPIHFQRTS